MARFKQNFFRDIFFQENDKIHQSEGQFEEDITLRNKLNVKTQIIVPGNKNNFIKCNDSLFAETCPGSGTENIIIICNV